MFLCCVVVRRASATRRNGRLGLGAALFALRFVFCAIDRGVPAGASGRTNDPSWLAGLVGCVLRLGFAFQGTCSGIARGARVHRRLRSSPPGRRSRLDRARSSWGLVRKGSVHHCCGRLWRGRDHHPKPAQLRRARSLDRGSSGQITDRPGLLHSQNPASYKAFPGSRPSEHRRVAYDCLSIACGSDLAGLYHGLPPPKTAHLTSRERGLPMYSYCCRRPILCARLTYSWEIGIRTYRCLRS